MNEEQLEEAWWLWIWDEWKSFINKLIEQTKQEERKRIIEEIEKYISNKYHLREIDNKLQELKIL